MVLTGENSFMLRTELQRIVDGFVKEHTDMALEQLDAEEVEYNRMREALESLPFLASRKMVVLRSPSASKQFQENAEKLLEDLPETTDVVIVESKLDKRTAYYKYLKKQSGFQEFSELDEAALAKWLAGFAAEQGASLSLGDARHLVERVGGSQQLLANETAKLAQYNQAITRASIDLLTEKTPQSTIFELLDAALAGNHARTLQLYDEQRAQKVEPQQVLALLGWQLHAMAIVKFAGDRDVNAIAKEAKLNPFVVRKTQGVVRRMPLAEIKQLIQEVLDLDLRLKSESIDADEALQNLLLTIVK